LLSVLLVSVGSDFYVATICLQHTVLNAAYGNQIILWKLLYFLNSKWSCNMPWL